jgi:bifunctional ADP-heptose synthase (sugar kinase/adenylyltransferase)
MDTRSKILTLAAARQLPPPIRVVTGYFDILRAGQVEDLSEARRHAKGPLLAIVLPRPRAALAQCARAELAAALRMIDYVVAADEADAELLIDSLRPAAVTRLEAADARRAAQLTEHVRERKNR